MAKPGARLVIVDETKKVVKSPYQHNPLTRSTFQHMPAQFDPRDWMPAGIKDANYQEVANGRIYLLTFTAPHGMGVTT